MRTVRVLPVGAAPAQPAPLAASGPWRRGKLGQSAVSGSSWRRACWRGLVGGLVKLLLTAPLLVTVLFDALGEQLQRLILLVRAEVALRADPESKGVGLVFDGVGGLEQELVALAVLVVAGECRCHR